MIQKKVTLIIFTNTTNLIILIQMIYQMNINFEYFQELFHKFKNWVVIIFSFLFFICNISSISLHNFIYQYSFFKFSAGKFSPPKNQKNANHYWYKGLSSMQFVSRSYINILSFMLSIYSTLTPQLLPLTTMFVWCLLLLST